MRRCAAVPALALALACGPGSPSLEEQYRSGQQHLAEGRLQAAEEVAEEGLRRARESRDPAWELRFRVLDAEVLVEDGREARALELLTRLTRPERALEPAYARGLMTRGRILCLSTGQPEELRRAAADLGEAWRLARRLELAGLAAEVARHRGTCALLRGDYPEAGEEYRESLQLARDSGRPLLEVGALANLGLLALWEHRYDEGAERLNRALDLASRAGADITVVKTLTNLGWAHYTLGDYERALSFLSRAEALADTRGYEGERAYALENIGNVHYQLEAFAKAADAYSRALGIARQQGARKLIAQLLSNLGAVALEMKQLDEAEAFVREALAIKAELNDLPGQQCSLLATGQIRAARGEADQAESYFHRVLGSPHSTPVVLWEARASLARLRVAGGRPAEAEAEFGKAFAIMEESRGELEASQHKISFFSSLRRFYETYVDFLVEEGQPLRALEVADASRARLLREMLTADQTTRRVDAGRFETLARDVDATILFYWLAPSRSFLWAITPGGASLYELPGEGDIRRRVDAYQTLVLSSRDPLAEEAEAGEWLFRALVGPVAGSLPPGARVIVVPDGALHRINPETLVVSSPQPHYWVEDATVLTAPSISVLASDTAPRRKLGGKAKSLLMIGDPLASGEEFPRLAHASRELSRISEQFEPTERTVYSGARATSSAYRDSGPERFSFIHFAAHAQTNREVPLDSAVILSPEDETSKLYAREIMDVPLHADLVTLSACHTAGSRTFAGEGLVGLTWAFLSSGARSVVAGLWNVEDASTSELMASLYQGLGRGEGPAEALRQAKLALLRSPTAYRKPFYWAPFIIYIGGSRASAPQHDVPQTP